MRDLSNLPLDLLRRAIERIENARLAYDPHHIVRFAAISKYASIAQIAELYACGQRAFGENKVQDLAQKSENLAALPIEWHFVGRIQSNKIGKLLDLRPALIHSIASLAQARQIDDRLAKIGCDQRALLQINSAREAEKSGVLPEVATQEYMAILESCPRIKLEGVMTIGSHSGEKSDVIKSFEITRDIFDRLPNATTLSMGMSGDYELAIKNGANLLRLGSILFNAE
ncbi:UPF0001 protein [Campylobacterota bacterium]|nr:UPF0001 protein [Campylobacterota bacterium]